MRLYLVGLELSFVASFECIGVIMSLENLVATGLIFLGDDVISLVVMVVGSFTEELSIGGWAMMPSCI